MINCEEQPINSSKPIAVDRSAPAERPLPPRAAEGPQAAYRPLRGRRLSTAVWDRSEPVNGQKCWFLPNVTNFLASRLVRRLCCHRHRRRGAFGFDRLRQRSVDGSFERSRGSLVQGNGTFEMDIAGKPALVVGGSGGLGRRLIERLAEAGADVAVGWSGGDDRAAEACEAVEKCGRRAVAVRLDLRNPASVEAGVAQAAEALGGLAILMNAAGAAGGLQRAISPITTPRPGTASVTSTSAALSSPPGPPRRICARAGRNRQFRLYHRARDLGR
jgi:hypothetical protein